VQSGALIPHWPVVACEFSKQYHPTTTTSKNCEVHRIVTAGKTIVTTSCKKHCEVHRITTAGKPIVTTSCKTWTWMPASTSLSHIFSSVCLNFLWQTWNLR
jgi:hypothetical protein